MSIEAVYTFLFGDWTINEILRNIFFLCIIYILMFSKTLIGVVMRIFGYIIVYSAFMFYAKDGEYLKGISFGLILLLAYFWPLIFKNIFKTIRSSQI